jgi:hypothetical protein
MSVGHAMAQVVSCWPLTTQAWVHTHVSSCGICGGQSGTGTGFLSPSHSDPPSISFHCGSRLIYIIWGDEQQARGGHSSDTVSPNRYKQQQLMSVNGVSMMGLDMYLFLMLLKNVLQKPMVMKLQQTHEDSYEW